MAHSHSKKTSAHLVAISTNKLLGNPDRPRKIYAVESEAKRKGITGEHLLRLRQEKAKPLLNDFIEWLSKKSLQVVPKSLHGKAVNYTLRQ